MFFDKNESISELIISDKSKDWAFLTNY